MIEVAQKDVLSITTANNTCLVTVVDPQTAQVRVRGGSFFSTTRLLRSPLFSEFVDEIFRHLRWLFHRVFRACDACQNIAGPRH